MPALGGFSPSGAFGGLRGDKPKIPQALFNMEAEEIIALLIGAGYSDRNARADVAKFMEYKARAVGPKQIWSDDDDETENEVSGDTPSRRFSEFVDKLRGGNDE